MNVSLGPPYEALMKRLIEKGYAGNQTELIRQALMAYERKVDEEEVLLVRKGVDHEMRLVESGQMKTIPFDKIKAKYSK
ncbi:hypothetical protein KJ765_00775 [Candidatus Micrarchaeota archaeon]|nr:hypothetical protein [Candidatus Micrarchaeota archaeon]